MSESEVETEPPSPTADDDPLPPDFPPPPDRPPPEPQFDTSTDTTSDTANVKKLRNLLKRTKQLKDEECKIRIMDSNI